MFGDELRQLRLREGLTQGAMAARLEVSTSSIGMYEQGRRQPDMALVGQICREFNVSADSLLNGAGEQPDELEEVIAKMKRDLMNHQGLMLKGELLTERDKAKIAEALDLVIELELIRSQKKQDPR